MTPDGGFYPVTENTQVKLSKIGLIPGAGLGRLSRASPRQLPKDGNGAGAGAIAISRAAVMHLREGPRRIFLANLQLILRAATTAFGGDEDADVDQQFNIA